MNKQNRREVNCILQSVANEHDLQRRIDLISAQFLGLPYTGNSLGGGDGLPEHLTIMLEAFDCVTYLEVVLALALSKNASEFEAQLLRIRYEKGEISWQSRNHYMLDWWRNNEKQGFVKNLTRGRDTEVKRRRLNVVRGLPEKRVSFRVIPKRRYNRLACRIKSGDLICFATAKQNLDVFHTGILVRRGDEIGLRHATRTAGKVIEQPLKDFLWNHRMSGFILLRPVENEHFSDSYK